jgi:hypothetical protein
MSLNARMGGGPVGLGVFSLVFGIAAYAAAFAFVERRPGHARTFYFHSTLALLLTLVGSRMMLEAMSQSLLWSVLAMAAAWLGGRFDRVTLRAHGAVYLLAASVVAGLAAGATAALLGDPSLPLPLAPAAVFVAGVAIGVYAVLVATRRRADASWRHLLPQATMAALVVWAAAGLAVRVLVAGMNAWPALALNPAYVATARTAVMAAMAVALAWTGRRWALRELIWLVYPVLALGALHLLVEDLRYGRPLTLFVSFALYGGALFACPKLLWDDPQPPEVQA